GVEDDEVAAWLTTADAMTIPFDSRRGVHQQSAGFTEYARWDFESTDESQYPLHSHFPYFDLYRKQVIKQADLVLALQFAPESFSSEQMARNFAYYEKLTVRDSSLSSAAQAVIAAWVGHLDLAVDYLTEAATIDIDDLRDDVDDGLHIAALAGVWTALVQGFGGMRESSEGLQFAPRLGAPMTRLSFGIRALDETLRVDVEQDPATYTLSGGAPLILSHFGRSVTVEAGTPLRMEIPALPDPGPAPIQPKGRAPRALLEALPQEN